MDQIKAHINCDGRISPIQKYQQALWMARAEGDQQLFSGVGEVRDWLKSINVGDRQNAFMDAHRYLMLAEFDGRLQVIRPEQMSHYTSETTEADLFWIDVSERVETVEEPNVSIKVDDLVTAAGEPARVQEVVDSQPQCLVKYRDGSTEWVEASLCITVESLFKGL